MNNIDNSIPVICHSSTGEYIGEFTSMKQACQKLYIRNPTQIVSNIHAKKSKGVPSYKSSNRYNFQLKSRANG